MTNKPLDQMAVANSSRRITFQLCPIDDMSMKDSLETIRALSQRAGFDYVVTPNMDHLQRLYLNGVNGKLRNIYKEASLSLCDSRVLEKIISMRGRQLTDVIPGSTLTEKLFEEILTEDDRIVLVGGDDILVDRLRRQYSDLSLFHINPSMGFIHKAQELESLVRRIEKYRGDYIFLAVGSPQQELLAHKLSQQLTRGVALCIGASLLFLAGHEKRAPLWVQRCCCEWAYRLAMNPRRLLKRYLLNFFYLPLISWHFVSPFNQSGEP